MSEPVDYRRRRLFVAIGTVLVLALVAGAVLLIRGGSDGEAPTSTTVPLPTEKAVDVIDRFHGTPCALIAAPEVVAATQREATVVGGGPPVLCTYGLAGKPTGDVVTAQVTGPQSNAQYEAYTAGANVVAGVPATRWLSGGGTGGRLLAHKGSVTIEIGVRLADLDVTQLQQIGRELILRALERIPTNTATSGRTSDKDCSLVATKAIAGLLGPDTEALPQINPAACSFRSGTKFVSVERITGNLPDLAAIKRSTSGPDGKQREWARTQLDLLDGGVYLADPDVSHKGGELYFRQKAVLFHVVVIGVTEPQGIARRLALLLLA